MPKEDGFTLAQQLSENDSTIDIPVVFVTARDTPEDVDTGSASAGMTTTKTV